MVVLLFPTRAPLVFAPQHVLHGVSASKHQQAYGRQTEEATAAAAAGLASATAATTESTRPRTSTAASARRSGCAKAATLSSPTAVY